MHCYENDHLLINYVNMSFASTLRNDCDKRMYYFEGRVACRDGYYCNESMYPLVDIQPRKCLIQALNIRHSMYHRIKSVKNLKH